MTVRRPPELDFDGKVRHRSDRPVRWEFGNRTADRSLPAADGPGFFLAPYSQELNPDELVRAHVKTRVAKAATQTRDELERMVDQTLRRLQTLPDIVAGFFRVLTCRYAAAAVPV